MSAATAEKAPKNASQPRKPVVDACDALVAWVVEHGTDRRTPETQADWSKNRSHGCLSETEFRELEALDNAFGDAIREYGAPVNSLYPPPEKTMAYGGVKAVSDALPNSNLPWRRVAAIPPRTEMAPVKRSDPDYGTVTEVVPMPVEGSGSPAKWWIMEVESWLRAMKKFRADVLAMKG